MNTEINLLEKQPKKYTNALILGIVFLLLLGLTVGVLLFQKANYENQLEQQNNKLSQLETALSNQDDKLASERQLQQLQQDITAIQAESTPHVALYNEMLGELSSSDMLRSYESANKNQLIVRAEFASLNEVAGYVTKLLKQNVIADTEITTVTNNGTTYQATLTIRIDSGLSTKELGTID